MRLDFTNKALEDWIKLCPFPITVQQAVTEPKACKHKEYGDGIAFSQYDKYHIDHCKAEYCLIVSNGGLHMPDKKLMPFSNEQPPTKMALLVLSAMVIQDPLNFKCPECD